MSDFGEKYVQQIIVPAYEWNDKLHSQAIVVATLRALQQTAAAHGKQIAGDPLDAEIDVHPLTAVVGTCVLGTGESVDFVAYEPCELARADLLHISVAAAVIKA